MRYFDLHCDTIGESYLQNVPLYRNDLNISLERASMLDGYVQAFACWIPDRLRGRAARDRFNHVYARLLQQTAKNPGRSLFCRGAIQMDEALQTGRTACFFTVEGSAALGGDLDAVAEFKKLGVSVMTLTWNGTCEAGDGCGVSDAKGLTLFGRKLVRLLEQHRIIVDVSHLSDRGFDDVATLAEQPFVATHSNSRSVCPHRRNLTDMQFSEIVRRGGLVGLNFYPSFISKNQPVSFQKILPHIEHFLSLGGENVLAIGADFDGAVTPANAGGELLDPLPYDLPGIQGIPALYRFLLRYYSVSVVNAIFFENAHHFFSKRLTAGS